MNALLRLFVVSLFICTISASTSTTTSTTDDDDSYINSHGQVVWTKAEGALPWSVVSQLSKVIPNSDIKYSSGSRKISEGGVTCPLVFLVVGMLLFYFCTK